ncbi:HAMP domain-containing histidine kinase [Paenibacillus sp. J5C_2022]|uniref:sensor histidine kinase n=1 Tax=Paenibacillus sp. J5C2022 TaxID=2977129 RepID=UPI0021D2FDAD|nr:HAMP domain-containing sensor histidine kinase [Paenibacillus sp. J5C2022]MCU6709974.1 HAMP domain-containing histidine kinase [Paenibacillus sp. J5C2022]
MLLRRLAARFALQMAMACVLLVIVAVFIVAWMIDRLDEIEIERNFAPLGISRLIEEAEVTPEGLIVDSQLLNRLEADGGWLQRLDESGEVLQSFNAPPDLPDRYIPGQLIDFWLKGESFPYPLGLWMQVKDGKLYTFLYGGRSPSEDMMRRVLDEGEIIENQIDFPSAASELLRSRKSWVQVLNAEGAEVASWQKPEGAPSNYSLSELVQHVHNPVPYRMEMYTKHDDATGLTWVLQSPTRQAERESEIGKLLSHEAGVMIVGVAMFFAAALVIFLILSLWFARRFMTPIVRILQWIRGFSEGHIPHVRDNIRVVSRNRKGKWRRGYSLFRDVIASVHELASVWQRGKEAEEETQKYREEWIAGVTHDMKTPLASIQGYAHMLKAEKYDWSNDEVRAFAATILEKAEFMDQLMNDLALTYRMKSGEHSVQLVTEDIGRLLVEVVKRTALHPAYAEASIWSDVPPAPVMAPIHAPWFERIVENMIANGILHNPPGTEMSVVLKREEENMGWSITFKDNGSGMEQELLDRLFDRYYRGTNTQGRTEGSGLGMAVTKELVQALGGRIQVHSVQGQGTVIRIVFGSESAYKRA